MYVPERMKGMARPIEYMTSKNIPFISVVSSDANASTEPKIGPIHGDQPKPNPMPTNSDMYGFVI